MTSAEYWASVREAFGKVGRYGLLAFIGFALWGLLTGSLTMPEWLMTAYGWLKGFGEALMVFAAFYSVSVIIKTLEKISTQLTEVLSEFNQINHRLEMIDGYLRNIERHATRL